jgi:hypothetical protein
MGYQVYDDPAAARWAGYGVPAECDWTSCRRRIHRGVAYRCDMHIAHGPEGEERIDEGCGRFFCDTHLGESDSHQGMKPKPDSAEWMYFMLTDESWAPWRAKDPAPLEALRAALQTAATESFLRPLYDDGYHPAHLIDQGRTILIRLTEHFERDQPKTLAELYALTHAATKEFNNLAEGGLEIETVAHEAISRDLGYVAAAYGFPEADLDELTASRTW